MPTVNLYQMPQVVQLHQPGAVSVSTVVNRTDFNLFRNVTNQVEFLIKDVDRKPFNLAIKSVWLYIVDDRTGQLLIQRQLVPISDSRGHCRLVLDPLDIVDWDPGYYTYSVTVQENGAQTVIYTDQNRSLRGHLELMDGPLPNPKPQIEIAANQFLAQSWGIPLQNYFVAEPFPGAAQSMNASGMHTLALYASNFTGTLWVQASLENVPPSTYDEWFDVTSIQLSNFTGVRGVQFTGSYMWVRFYYQPDISNAGSITKALLKN